VTGHVLGPNTALAQSGQAQAAIKTIAKYCLLTGGAIKSPAVLLSSAPPQSAYCDHLPKIRVIDGAIGYALEAPLDGVFTRLAQGWGKRLGGHVATPA
jgi:hypothetical protein